MQNVQSVQYKER